MDSLICKINFRVLVDPKMYRYPSNQIYSVVFDICVQLMLSYLPFCHFYVYMNHYIWYGYIFIFLQCDLMQEGRLLLSKVSETSHTRQKLFTQPRRTRSLEIYTLGVDMHIHHTER